MSIDTKLNSRLNPLDNFTVLKLIEKSKYPVYKALDKRTNKEVALKIFPSTTGGSICYEREKNFLIKFSHSNIITLFESGQDCFNSIDNRSVSYLSIECAQYGDMLGLFMKYGCMPETLARSVFRQIVEGVSHMHSCGIAHMDLKLDNILIDDNFNAKVIDFDVSQSMTDTKQFGSGTVVYRSPEVKNKSTTNYAAADIYSLGIILFILMSGSPPYEETQREYNGPFEYSRGYILMRKNNARYWEREAKARGSRTFYPKEFIELVNWMLSEDPEQRPSLEKLKNHVWYRGDILEGRHYTDEMKKFMLIS